MMPNTEFTFRPLTDADLPMLHDWLSRPHVAEWWGTLPTFAELGDEYGPLIRGEVPHQAFIALANGSPLGFIQSYVPSDTHDEGWWLDEHDPGVRGIDQFLANEHQLGKGLGTAMIRAFIARLLDDPSVTRIQTDPSPHNGRAIRSYEKAGFREVQEVETPDGRALLMYCDRPAVRTDAPANG
jgi:aminoglycoside 6'-N-acetyltransferase Ib